MPTEATFPSRSSVKTNDAVRDADDELVARCRSGDRDAFASLYRSHSGRIFALACRISGSRTDGEDLLQDIFLQVFQKLDAFKGGSTFGTWLYRLAVNRSLDFVRSRQTRAARSTDPLDDARPPAREPVDDPAGRMDLERAIEQLPDGYRTVFVLHDVEGFQHDEIAGLMSISAGTSKSQLFKARMRLRELLAPRTAAP